MLAFSGFSKNAVPFCENLPLHHHNTRSPGRDPPVKNLTEQRNSRRRSSKRTLAHATLSLLGDKDATVRPHSDHTLTNSQRSLWITAHHLSAVTSICPLVDSATYIWAAGMPYGFWLRRLCCGRISLITSTPSTAFRLLAIFPLPSCFSPHHSSVRSVLRTTWTMATYRRNASGHSPHISMSNVRRILTRVQ